MKNNFKPFLKFNKENFKPLYPEVVKKLKEFKEKKSKDQFFLKKTCFFLTLVNFLPDSWYKLNLNQ